jgi:hypothetical protein
MIGFKQGTPINGGVSKSYAELNPDAINAQGALARAYLIDYGAYVLEKPLTISFNGKNYTAQQLSNDIAIYCANMIRGQTQINPQIRVDTFTITSGGSCHYSTGCL